MKQQLLYRLLVAVTHLCCIGRSLGVQYVSHKNCNHMAKGTFVANPGDCNQYIQCNGLRSTLGKCPEGRFFNAKLLSCDTSRNACRSKDIPAHQIQPLNREPEEKILTTVEPAVISTSTVLQETSATVPPPHYSLPAATYALGRPICIAWYDQLLPHPYNCEYYYQCLHGYLIIRRCYLGFGWDLRYQRCVPMQHAYCFRNPFSG